MASSSSSNLFDHVSRAARARAAPPISSSDTFKNFTLKELDLKLTFSASVLTEAFSHHYQGSVNSNTINIHKMDEFPECYDQQRSYFPIHSLLPRECIGKYGPRGSISRYTP